ncbi:MAG: hypothetical protein K9K86_01720 [Pseudomonadales bacterium]|nr:hypothetical protein [Pseudomonadales bacterium]
MPEGASGPKGWSTADKFAAVLKITELNKADFISEHCLRAASTFTNTDFKSACKMFLCNRSKYQSELRTLVEAVSAIIAREMLRI